MLGRAPRPLAVCLRCQSRLAENHQPWRRSPGLLNAARPHLRRQTSAAAVHVDHDNQSDNHSQTSTSQTPNPEPTAESSKPHKNTRYRRWRPDTVRELGVDVLGRPAEVLIIPSRDPKTSSPKSEQVQHAKQGSLQASLDSELVPVSIDEALRNIDLLKGELGQDNNEFTLTEWKSHRRRLSDSFTRAQLQEYLRVAYGGGDVVAQDNTRSASGQKHVLATTIMQNAWGWTCSDLAETKPSQPMTRRTVSLDRLKLDFIMRDTNQPLRQISEACGAQVDVFKSEGRVELSGPALAVGNANFRLRQLAKSIQESSLPVTEFVSDLLSDGPGARDLLGKLMQKHNVLIKADATKLNIISHSPNGAGVVSRDLLMFSGRFQTAVPFSIWRDESRQELVKVPFYLDDVPEWSSQGKSWYRHVSQTARHEIEDKTTDAGQREARRRARHLTKLLQSDEDASSRFDIKERPRTRYVVDIGQVLFSHPDPEHTLPSPFFPNPPATPSADVAQTLFVPYLSLLPQILAKKDFISNRVMGNGRTAILNQTTQPFLLRLRLRPVDQDVYNPSLEILLSGADTGLGLRQQLEIKEITLVLAERRHDLLLPHQPVDVRVTARHEISLLGSATKAPAKKYLAVLRQIGLFLEKAQSSDNFEFAPFWSIDLSGLLKDDTGSQQDKDKQPSPLSRDLADLSGSEALGTNRGTSNASTTLYVLDPPEYLDIATYTSTLTGANVLQSVSCDAGPVEKPTQRHMLQIVETPLSDLLPNKDRKEKPMPNPAGPRQELFKHAVEAAHSLATLFDKLSRSTT